MSDFKKIRQNPNSSQFRNKLTERYRIGIYDAFEIWLLYGISRSLLHKWNCQYYRNRFYYPRQQNLMKYKQKSDKARIAELERQLKVVRAAYAEEKLAKEMYEKLIRIAEEMFNIPIRKKAGAKLLRKEGETTRS